jgi:hypothetical protein
MSNEVTLVLELVRHPCRPLSPANANSHAKLNAFHSIAYVITKIIIRHMLVYGCRDHRLLDLDGGSRVNSWI